MIDCEVCYMAPGVCFLRALRLVAGSTIAQAIAASGLAEAHPEADPVRQGVGVHSRRRALDDLVCDGDRIEVYRALVADPKSARRRKVARQREAQPDRWTRR